MFSKYMSVLKRLRGERAEVADFSDYGPLVEELADNKRAQRPQRSGGMPLCLWKVCPAAPWLI